MDMILIHADSNMRDIGVIDDYISYDAVSALYRDAESSDWQLVMTLEAYNISPINTGDYIYVEDSEFGGRVGKIQNDTAVGTVTIGGYSWRGIISKKIIVPPEGQTHLSLTCDANAALEIITSGHFEEYLTVETEPCGVGIHGDYRFVNMLSAIEDSLSDSNLRLKTQMDGSKHKLILSAVPIKTHNMPDYYDADITAILDRDSINHLIALGGGEMLERRVMEFWRLPDGTITNDRTANGIPTIKEYRSEVYDYSNVEDDQELESGAKERFKSLDSETSISISFDNNILDVPVGDKINVYDDVTGISGIKTVVRRTLTIKGGELKIQHKVE